jgi:hypothetical protein
LGECIINTVYCTVRNLSPDRNPDYGRAADQIIGLDSEDYRSNVQYFSCLKPVSCHGPTTFDGKNFGFTLNKSVVENIEIEC